MDKPLETKVPDPNGPPVQPEPIEETIWHYLCTSSIPTSLALAVGGTAALFLMLAVPSRTMGAQRSHRMRWEERKQEIADVQAQEATDAHANANPQADAPHD